MRGHGYRVSAALALTALAAGAATLALRPRSGLVEPAAVQAGDYFSAEQIARAEAFRGGQRALAFAGLGLSGGALVLVALRPPRRMLERAGARPIAVGALLAAGGSLALGVLTLPLDALAHARAVEVGLSTQTAGPWLADVGRATAISAATAAGVGALLLGLARRFPRRWWMPAAGSAVALGVVFVYLAPVVLDPLFNRFAPVPGGPLRTEVLDLARRSGVEVGQVYRVDASRRTTAVNAYVGGLGRTKRVVLYDNLIEDLPPGQVRSVVAHELAHQRHRDILRGLTWLAIVAPASMLLVQRLTEAFAPRAAPGSPSSLPALALALALVSFAGGVASNSLSRAIEARADAFALDLTGEAGPFVALERSLTIRNVADPDPPTLTHLLFDTHPTAVERIGYGVAYGAR